MNAIDYKFPEIIINKYLKEGDVVCNTKVGEPMTSILGNGYLVTSVEEDGTHHIVTMTMSDHKFTTLELAV